MSKVHVNMFTGAIGVCEAEVGNCPVSDPEGHFDSKEEARPASEKRLSEIYGGPLRRHGKKIVSESFGNLPFKDDDFKSAIDYNLRAWTVRLEDELMDEAIQIEEDNAYSNDPAEFNEIEVVLNRDETTEYLALASEKLLRDKPEIFDEVLSTGYPFINSKQLAAAVVARDVISLIDKDAAFIQHEPFNEIRDKFGEDRYKEILDKVYAEVEQGGGVDHTMKLSLDLVDSSTSRYTKSYDAVPPSEQMRELREALGK